MSFGPTLFSQNYPDDPVDETYVDSFLLCMFFFIELFWKKKKVMETLGL